MRSFGVSRKRRILELRVESGEWLVVSDKWTDN